MSRCGNSLSSGPEGSKRKVLYYYDEGIGNFLYAKKGVKPLDWIKASEHNMKPLRLNLTFDLVDHYGLTFNPNMTIARPWKLEEADLIGFHDKMYIDSLKYRTAKTNGDCPINPGLYNFCLSSAGGSVAAAASLNLKKSDITINWSGGLHHARGNACAGFCYVNDIVLAIQELLRYHQRVLYLDIDVHHGDGVQGAFWTSNRVMTVSFHMYGGKFYPQTGSAEEKGESEGENYAVNVPLEEGISDDDYHYIFRPIMGKVMEVFQPGAVVLQCGADSLAGDQLGTFNLTIKGHAECVKFMRSFNVPLMLLGGGGYSINNVARCWCYETAVALGVELDDRLPEDLTYPEYYPSKKLHYKADQKYNNKNKIKNLDDIKRKVFENLSRIEAVPTVHFHQPPPSIYEDRICDCSLEDRQMAPY